MPRGQLPRLDNMLVMLSADEATGRLTKWDELTMLLDMAKAYMFTRKTKGAIFVASAASNVNKAAGYATGATKISIKAASHGFALPLTIGLEVASAGYELYSLETQNGLNVDYKMMLPTSDGGQDIYPCTCGKCAQTLQQIVAVRGKQWDKDTNKLSELKSNVADAKILLNKKAQFALGRHRYVCV